MSLFQTVNDLQAAIQNALPDWVFQLNSTIVETENHLQINPRMFHFVTTPENEVIVFCLVGTNLTGTDRSNPQIRIQTEKFYNAYQYAKAHALRYFAFAYCQKPARGEFSFPGGTDGGDYLVSLECPLFPTRTERPDIRSMYDILKTRNGQEFFRVTPDMHGCSGLARSAFIRIRDDSGSFSITNLENYLRYFDSRPYMSDAQNGTQAIYIPSTLYEPDNTPLALPWNLLVHGAPGTGKSYLLDSQVEMYKAAGVSVETQRITFYEDYSYGQFVGQYMPVPEENSIQQLNMDIPGGTVSGSIASEHITYRFAPGPLSKLLAKSLAAKLNGNTTKFILIIEEFNRANAASVFGDVFQLLDRKNGLSIYEITPSSELAQYLYVAISSLLSPGIACPSEDAFAKIRLPDNLYIWATMNGADQGVFPLDSAFKRRWSYIYRNIDEVDPAAALRPRICLPWRDGEANPYEARQFDWNSFRSAINEIILAAGFAEDRCVGYWYFSEEELRAIEKYTTATVENQNGTATNDLTALPNPLVDKLFAYLLQDVFRNMPTAFFKDDVNTLSKIRQRLKTLATGGLDSIVQLPHTAYVPRPTEA